MFKGNRYMTIGIKEEIGLDIQIVMWGLIQELSKKKGFELDYLQVFELEPVIIDGLEIQQIIHRQEVEPYSDTKVFSVIKPVSAKVFVIDEKEYCTMLLSSEY